MSLNVPERYYYVYKYVDCCIYYIQITINLIIRSLRVEISEGKDAIKYKYVLYLAGTLNEK